MHGIVSLLDERHDRLVRALWAELAREWGIRAVAERVPFPHFSYQVAGDYDDEDVMQALQHLTAEVSPFTVRTSGLGIFTGAQPVFYISVCRSEELSALHQAIWDNLSGASRSLDLYFQPEQWEPHITLAQGDLSPDLLGRIIAALSGRNFSWEIAVDQLSWISTTESGSLLRRRFSFGGASAEALS